MLSEPEIQAFFRSCAKNIIYRGENYNQPPIDILSRLPQRDFLLLVDQMTHIDHHENIIVTQYGLHQSEKIFSAHFPHLPIWPGIFQIEAIKQTSHLFFLEKDPSSPEPLLKNIKNARFMHPISPQKSIEFQVRIFNNGTAIGQCIIQNKIASVIWLSFILNQ